MDVEREPMMRLKAVVFVAISSSCLACGANDREQPESPYYVPLPTTPWSLERLPLLEAPEVIPFGIVPIGQAETREFVVANRGRAPLNISAWTLEGPFELRFEGFMGEARPTRLEVGEQVRGILTHTATDSEGATGAIHIQSDDPAKREHTIRLSVGESVPCMELVERQVDFGVISPNERGEQVATLRNCSDSEPLTVIVAMDTREGAFSRAQMSPRTLAPGESYEIVLGFAPPRPGRYETTLEVTHVQTGERAEVPVVGEGSQYACPNARIRATRPERDPVTASPTGVYRGLPLDRVSLSAQPSSSPDGAQIVRYEWALISRPPDSSAALERPRESSTNELYLDLSGSYQVELHVWDSRDARSCRAAVLTLEAIPDEDIHVQLVWDTPADSDQTRGLGADVDLHFRHELGRWNQSPGDCNWMNREPDWGARNDSSDDPSLDIDDTNGLGPENINLNKPENNRSYGIGVYYFSDHGFGISYATVRLYIGGLLVREKRRQPLRDGQFWDVMQVAWPSAVVTDRDLVRNGFPR